MHRTGFLLAARAALAALVICVALSATGKTAEAQPKFWNTAKANGVNLHFGTSPTISLELQKWRKKSTLVVDATVRSTATPADIVVTPTVSGVSLDPFSSVSETCDGACYVAARWALDLDQANIDHPGVFTSNGASGLPLTVSLQAFATGGFSPTGHMLLTAEIKKKK